MPRPRRSPSEAKIQGDILLRLGRGRALRVWRQSTGVANPIGQPEAVVRYGTTGQGDIGGIADLTCPCCGEWRIGARLEIEVKDDEGAQEESQVRYERMIRRHSGLYVVVRSVEEAERFIDRLPLT